MACLQAVREWGDRTGAQVWGALPKDVQEGVIWIRNGVNRIQVEVNWIGEQVLAALPHSFEDVVDYTKSEAGAKSTFKVMYIGPDWLDYFGLADKHGPLLGAMSQAGKVANNVVIGVAEMPKKSWTLFVEATKVANGYADGAYVLFSEGVFGAVGAVCDIWASVQKDIELFWQAMPKETGKAIKLAGNVLLAIGSFSLVIRDGIVIAKRIIRIRPTIQGENVQAANDAEIANRMLTIGRSVSYLALGVLGCASSIFAVEIAPIAFLICVTSALFFSIATHFHKEHEVKPAVKRLNEDERKLIEMN